MNEALTYLEMLYKDIQLAKARYGVQEPQIVVKMSCDLVWVIKNCLAVYRPDLEKDLPTVYGCPVETYSTNGKWELSYKVMVEAANRKIKRGN